MSPLASETVKLVTGILLFVAAMVVLVYIFIRHPRLTDDQRALLRFFCAIAAGLAGAFLSGDALFRLNEQWSAKSSMLVEGTAGCALLMFVWFTFPRSSPAATPPASGPPPTSPPAVHFTLLDGMHFQQAATIVAQLDGCTVDLSSLTAAECQARMIGRELHCADVVTAMRRLGDCTDPSGSVRPYKVRKKDAQFTLTPK